MDIARPILRSTRCQSIARHLELAYDKHDAPSGTSSSDSGPIVFLHGLFGSKRNNRSISKVLARDLKRPVYALDLRNHGDSPHDSVHDYNSMAQDVEHFLRTHALSRTTLMGHSMGAKVAMTVALRQSTASSTVRNLISIDNAPLDAALKSDFAKYVRGMKAVTSSGVDRLSKADEILAPYEPDMPIRQFLLTNLVKDPATGTMRWRVPIDTLGKSLDHMADFPFRDPDEARFEGPALFVRGTKSQYVADEALPVIGRFFPRFEVVDVEAGHWVASENPEAFRKAVVDFLVDR